jgi:cytochrome c5
LTDQTRENLDISMLVTGLIVGTVVGLIFFVTNSVLESQGSLALDDEAVQSEINANIAPVGQVVLLGSAELAAAESAPVVTPQLVATPLTGPQVYNQACVACHAAPGIGGAPVTGDGAAWAGRAEQGIETLTQHVLNGFQGSTGVMPPKGGRLDLSDAEIISAMEYMLEQLGQ